MTLAILFSLKTMELLENRLQPHSGVTPLFSIRTESLVSSQSCRSIDAECFCKRPSNACCFEWFSLFSTQCLTSGKGKILILKYSLLLIIIAVHVSSCFYAQHVCVFHLLLNAPLPHKARQYYLSSRPECNKIISILKLKVLRMRK